MDGVHSQDPDDEADVLKVKRSASYDKVLGIAKKHDPSESSLVKGYFEDRGLNSASQKKRPLGNLIRGKHKYMTDHDKNLMGDEHDSFGGGKIHL